MTATNMCSNFRGKWDSPPHKSTKKRKEDITKRLFDCVVDVLIGNQERSITF